MLELGAVAGFAITLAFVWIGLILLGALVRDVFGHDLLEASSELFDSFLAGLVVFVVVIALCFTAGQTLMVAVLPILLFVARKPRHPDPQRLVSIGRAAIQELPPVLVAFLLPVLLVHRGEGPWPLGIPHWDDVFFGRLAMSLIETGCENIRPFLSSFQMGACGMSPYHYAEEWVGGSVAWAAGGSPSHLFLFVVGPVLMAGAWLGLVELLAAAVASARWRKALAAGIVLLPAPHFSFLSGIRPLEEAIAFGGMNLFDLRAGAAKQAIVVLALVATIRAVERGLPHVAYLVLLVLVPFSASAAPAALFWALFVLSTSPRAGRLRLIALGASALTMLVTVLVIFGEANTSVHSVKSLSSLAGSWEGLQTRFNIVAKTSLQLVVAFSPWWILLGAVSVKSRSTRQVFWGACLASLGGILGYAAVFQLPDAPQFATRFPALLLQMVCSLAVVRFASVLAPSARVVVGLLLAFAGGVHIFDARSETLRQRSLDYRWRQTAGYLDSARRFVPSTPIGAFLLSPSEIPAGWDPSTAVPTFTPNVYAPGMLVGAFPQYRVISLLSPPDPSIDPYRFALAQLAPEWAVRSGTAGEQAGRIMKAYCVSFLIATRGASLPSGARLKLVAQDAVTGERLIEVLGLSVGCKALTSQPASFWRTMFLVPE